MRARGTITITALAGAALLLAATGAVAPSAQAAVVVDSSTYTVATEVVPGGTIATLGGQHGGAVTITGSTLVAPLWGGVRVTLRPAAGGRFAAGQVADPLWVNSWNDQYVPPDVPSASFPFVSGVCPTVATDGYLRVDAAEYDAAGTLTSFAGHVRVTCRGSGATIDSDVRVASALPAHATTFFSRIGLALASGTLHPTVVNRGNVAETIGDVTLGALPAGWTATIGRGTCPATLATGASCTLDVTYDTGGQPGALTLHVATPDSPTTDLVGTLPLTPDSGPATVTTRPAGDGVVVAWASTANAYYPTDYDLYSSPHGAGTWTLLTTTSGTGYGDTSMAPSETVDYRVVSRKFTSPVGTGPVSAVVSGTRLATAETGDATINETIWSTPDDTWPDAGTNTGSRLFALPDGPGTYSLQGDVHLGSLVQSPPLTGCGRPTGTMVVRDLVRAAGAPTGHIIRLDASVTGTCHDGRQLAGEIRVGVAGAPHSRVITGYQSAPRTPAWVGLPSTVTFALVNEGAPATLGAPTVLVDGVTATSSLTTTCGATLATSGRCEVTVTFTPTAEGTGRVGVTLPGVGLLGSTVLTYPVTVLADTTPPVVTPLRVPAFVDRQDWISGAPFTDAQSGETTEDARARVAKSTATALSDYLYPKAWQGVGQGILGSDAGQLLLGFIHPGQEYCISYRARDAVGNVSAWTPEQCRTQFWDDNILETNQQGWTYRINNGYYTGTYTTTTFRGLMLTGPYVNARRIAVLATTCARCGSVDVYVGSTRVGSLSLHSRSGHSRVVLQVPLRSKPIAGRLHIVVTSSGRPVYIDGIGASLT